jgi:hypothetical protein
MLSFAHQFVRVHSRLQDNQHVSTLTVDPDGEDLLVTVVSRQCVVYERRLPEDEVAALKGGVHATADVPWAPFFEMLQKAYVDRAIEFNASTGVLKIQVKHERTSEALPVAAFTTSVSVTLSPAAAGSQRVPRLADAMLDYLVLRMGEKSEQSRIDALCSASGQYATAADAVVTETDMLRTNTAAFEAQIADAEKQMAEMEKLLDASASPGVAGGWKAALQEVNTARVACRVPTSLSQRPRLMLNDALLTALKIRAPGEVNVWTGLRHDDNNSSARTSPRSSVTGSTAQAGRAGRGGDKDGKIDFSHALCFNVVAEDAVVPSLTAEEQAALEAFSEQAEWAFDTTEFDATCRKCAPANCGALFYLGYTAVVRLDLHAKFNMNERALLEWLAVIEAGYRDVPFHNAQHAAETLHAVLFMLGTSDMIRKLRLRDVDVLAVVLAAIVIDFDHPGVTNRHLGAMGTFAAQQNPTGTIEGHSVAAAFELMKLAKFDFLGCVSARQRAALQADVARLVIATDKANHARMLTALQRVVGRHRDVWTPGEVPVLLAGCLKAADVAFVAKSVRTYSLWVKRVLQEYDAQTAAETAAGIELTHPPCVDAEDKAQAQLNLINVVALPLYSTLCDVVPRLRETGELIAMNKKMWSQ